MAKAQPNSLEPQAPLAKTGPEIVLMGEGAELVKFEIDPSVTRYTVFPDGRVLGDM